MFLVIPSQKKEPFSGGGKTVLIRAINDPFDSDCSLSTSPFTGLKDVLGSTSGQGYYPWGCIKYQERYRLTFRLKEQDLNLQLSG